jgi:hypothetical protein
MPTPLTTSRGDAPQGRARTATPQGPMGRPAAAEARQGQGAAAGMPVFLRRQGAAAPAREGGDPGGRGGEPGGRPAELRVAGTAAARSGAAATGATRTAAAAGAGAGLGVGAAVPAPAGGTGGAATGLHSGGADLLMPEPAAGLSAAEQQRLNSVGTQAASAAAATSAMPPAEQTVADARSAVAEPQAEANARAAAALSEALGERAAPSPEIEALCTRIQEAIRRRRPPDEDALVQFDPRAATQAAGDELNASVQGQSEQVQGNYQQLQQPPSGAPAPPAQPLSPPAGQVESPPIDAQAAVPDPVPPETVSLDADVAANGNRISEAGMASEASALITDPANPVSQAREGQANLSEAAARDPQEVLAEQSAVRDQALGAMQDLQARTLAALQASRVATATGVGGGMVRMGGTEAQMRTQASSQAQTIFHGARDQVRSLLEPLPRTALQRWQSGIAVLSSQVEQDSEQFNRWKRERYEGVSGAALELVEGVIGLPDWAIAWLNGIEERFGAGVCDLLREISVEVNSVIASCEDIIAAANTRIKEVFDALPESLRDWAAGEQAQFSAQLDGLRQEAQNSRDSFNRQLSQEASQAVQSVRERIHTMRQEAGGWVGQISAAIERFAENPARFIVEGLLQRLGINPSAFWGVVNRIGSVIDSIAADPLGFAGTLARAMRQGFHQFFSNAATHLSGGLFAWLFSGLGSVGVQIPSDVSLGSLITFFLQLMGITWDRIRGMLARHIGEENVALLERAYELIALLIERGPAGIFEMLREQLNPQMILDQILSSAVDFLIDALIRAVTPRIIGLFNPAGAILQAIEAIYRILSWLFENAARLFGLVETVVNGAAELIAGNVGGMANAVEGSLARLIAPVIDFLAGYLGLGNLPNRIAETISSFQEMVLRVIDRVVAWIAQRARGLLRALGVGGEERDANALDARDHPAVAKRAAEELEAKDNTQTGYSPVLATKKTQAREIERRYSSILENGIGLFVRLGEEANDKQDGDIDFEIIIAPNTTTYKSAIELDPEILVVNVADVKPPGISAIGAMSPSPSIYITSSDPLAQISYERHVADQISTVIDHPRLRGVTRNGRAALEGGSLPSAGRSPLPPLFFAEPKLNISGERIADEQHWRPDLITFAPNRSQQIEVFEVTLDSNFMVPAGSIRRSPEEPKHKAVQISGSLKSLLEFYPHHPVVFNIRCPREPGDNAKRILNTILHEMKSNTENSRFQIIWRHG